MKLLWAVIPTLLSLTAAASPLCAQGPNKPAAAPEPPIQTGGEMAALAAADVWLAQVDDARYADSWQATAALFQKAEPQERWVALMNSRRQPLGKVSSRKNISRQFTRKVPGTPDGQYVVLLYNTSFEHKPDAVETVTTLLDADGRWKIVGYLVH